MEAYRNNVRTLIPIQTIHPPLFKAYTNTTRINRPQNRPASRKQYHTVCIGFRQDDVTGAFGRLSCQSDICDLTDATRAVSRRLNVNNIHRLGTWLVKNARHV
jgi:hypothetical protein